MPIKPFRQITPALVPPALTDQVVGVQGGAKDVLWTFNQISEVIGGGGGGGGGRTRLTANTNYYVATSGSDANPGTQAAPWLTLQHAMNVISGTIDTGGFNAIVNIGPGSFAGVGLKAFVGGGAVEFLGAGVASTTITNGPNDGVINHGECFSSYSPLFCAYYINQLTCSPTANSAIVSSAGWTAFVIGCDPNTLTSGAINFHVTPGSSSAITLFGPLATLEDSISGQVPAVGVSGSVGVWAFLGLESFMALFGTYTFTGSPTYSAFLFAQDHSFINFGGTTSGAFSGPLIFAELGTTAEGPASPANGVVIDYSSSYNGQPGTDLSYPQATTSLRTVLTGNTNFYVSATGSDSNNGSISAPWATLQHAAFFVANNLDFGGFAVIVNIGAGTFAGLGIAPTTGGGLLLFKGAGSSSTIINHGPNDGAFNFFECFTVNFPTSAEVSVDGVTFNVANSGTGIAVYVADVYFGLGNGQTFTTDVIFDFTNFAGGIGILLTAQMYFQVVGGGTITLKGSGATAAIPLFITSGATYENVNCNWTVTGTPAVSPAFLLLSTGAKYIVFAGGTFSGAATGPQVSVTGGSSVSQQNVSILGPNYFPGSTPGIVDSSSSFNGQPGTDLTYPQQLTALRTILTANTTFNVATTGSDSNPGTAALPWLTLQHAMDFIASKIDIGGFAITINIGAGSFAGVGIRATVGGGNVNFVGAGSTSTTLTNGNNDGQTNFGESIAVFSPVGSQINFDRVKLAPNKSGVVGLNDAIDIFAFVRMNLYVANNDVAVDCTGLAGSDIMFWIDAPGVFVQDNGLTITGGSASIGSLLDIENGADYLAGNNGSPWHVNGTLTVNPFLAVDSGALFQAPTFVGGGAVVGQRFLVILDGHVTGFGLTPTSIPGTIAGVCDSSSTYGAQPGTALTYPQPTTILRTIITATTTNFYVSATGSDSNNGSISAPWATLQHAATFIAETLDVTNPATVFVNIGAGTFVGATFTLFGLGTLRIYGAGSASTTLTPTSIPGGTGCLSINAFTGFAVVNKLKFDMQDAGGHNAGLSLDGGTICPGDDSFGGATDLVWTDSLGTGTGVCLVIATIGNYFTAFGPYKVTATSVLAVIEFGSAANGISGAQSVLADFGTWTVGPLTIASGGAVCQLIGDGQYQNASGVATWSGTVTGKRFDIRANSYASGASPGALGPNYFPGSLPGTCDASSFYDGFPGPFPGINTYVTGHTFTIADAFERAEYNGTGAGVFIVPGSGTVNYDVGTWMKLTQINTGNASFAAGSGVTLHNAGSLGGQWRSGLVYKRGTDEWVQTNV